MVILDWIIVALFLVGLTAIGFLFSRRNKNIEDYFVAGRSMPTWLVALAATGTSISAGTFVGSPELGFNTNIITVGRLFCIQNRKFELGRQLNNVPVPQRETTVAEE